MYLPGTFDSLKEAKECAGTVIVPIYFNEKQKLCLFGRGGVW